MGLGAMGPFRQLVHVKIGGMPSKTSQGLEFKAIHHANISISPVQQLCRDLEVCHLLLGECRSISYQPAHV